MRALLGLAAALAAAASFAMNMPAEAAEKTSVGALAFVSSAPIFIAKEKGYFDQQGLDVEVKFFQAAQPIAVAVASGDVDFGITGLTGGFFNLGAKGALKMIAAQSREEPGFDFVGYLVSPKAYEAGFKSVKDYPGKTVGITTVGSTFHYNIGMLADKYGFKLADVSLKPLQTVPNMVAAMKGGQVDSILLPANQAFGLEKDGSGKIIGWVHQHTPWQLGALFTSSKNASGKRPMVQKFVDAYVMACADYAAAFHERDASGKRVFGPKADALIPMLQKYVKPEPTSDQVKASVSFIDPQGRLMVRDLYNQVAWYKAQGMVDADADAKTMIDLGFLKQHLDLPN